ncbi:MAG TPA: hypothetical protein VF466_02125 [Candidatus Saccharimonadales bacterium]
MKDETTTTSSTSEWPGAFGIFKVSRDRVRKNLEPLIWLAVLAFAADFVLGLLFRGSARSLGQLISSLVGVYFAVVTTRAYLLTASEKSFKLEAVLQFPPALYWRMLLLNIMIILTVVGGIILLIVPGIIFALRLSMSPYFLIDKNMAPMDAYKASWNATKGHMGKLWGLLGVALLMLLPVLTIVGILATIYLFFMYAASGALLYLYLRKHAKNA